MRLPRAIGALCAAALSMDLAACGAGGGPGGAGGGPTTIDPGGGSGGISMGGSVNSGSFNGCAPGGTQEDLDQDGFTPEKGDCDDCDPDRNPQAIDWAGDLGEVVDADCNGVTGKSTDVFCDGGLAIDEADPMAAARAIELCKVSAGEKDWGVVSARWTLADGEVPPPEILPVYHLGHGLLPRLGPNVRPRAGMSLLALSSGTARQPGDVGYQDVGGFPKGYVCGQPEGFPKESPACEGLLTGEPHDAAALEVTIRPPSNARGFSFDFKFQTYEWPNFICSQYNDLFLALLSPAPPGLADANVIFDAAGNLMSVNNIFIEVCGCPENPPSSCQAKDKTFDCPRGDLELIGTGFGFDSCATCQDHGATGWLRTTAPIDGAGPFTVRWTVFDSSDGVLDSTALVDAWRWIAGRDAAVATERAP